MKRTVRRDIRWNQLEINRINDARGEQEFSEFVRNATMDKVIKYENELLDTKEE